METSEESVQKINTDNERQIEECQKSLASIRHEYRLATEGLAHLGIKYEHETQKVYDLKEKLKEKKKENIELVSQLSIKQSQIDARASKADMLKTAIKECKTVLEEKSATVIRLQEKIKYLTDKLENGSDDHRRLADKLAEEKAVRDSLRKRVAEMEAKVDSYDNQLRDWIVEKATIEGRVKARLEHQYGKQISDLQKKLEECEKKSSVVAPSPVPSPEPQPQSQPIPPPITSLPPSQPPVPQPTPVVQEPAPASVPAPIVPAPAAPVESTPALVPEPAPVAASSTSEEPVTQAPEPVDEKEEDEGESAGTFTEVMGDALDEVAALVSEMIGAGGEDKKKNEVAGEESSPQEVVDNTPLQELQTILDAPDSPAHPLSPPSPASGEAVGDSAVVIAPLIVKVEEESVQQPLTKPTIKLPVVEEMAQAPAKPVIKLPAAEESALQKISIFSPIAASSTLHDLSGGLIAPGITISPTLSSIDTAIILNDEQTEEEKAPSRSTKKKHYYKHVKPLTKEYVFTRVKEIGLKDIHNVSSLAAILSAKILADENGKRNYQCIDDDKMKLQYLKTSGRWKTDRDGRYLLSVITQPLMYRLTQLKSNEWKKETPDDDIFAKINKMTLDLESVKKGKSSRRSAFIKNLLAELAPRISYSS